MTHAPRLQGYILPSLYQHYQAWKEVRGLTTDSQALNQLLTEFFGVVQAPNSARLEVLEGK